MDTLPLPARGGGAGESERTLPGELPAGRLRVSLVPAQVREQGGPPVAGVDAADAELYMLSYAEVATSCPLPRPQAR
jgi:hypothetical protein